MVAFRLIAQLGPHFTTRGRRRGTVVLSAAPGDRHALPSAIVADLLRAESFDVVDLGADTPAEDLVELAGRQDRLVAVGVCATSPRGEAEDRGLTEMVDALRNVTDCPVLLGGRTITESIVARAQPDGWSRDADEAVQWICRQARPGSAASPGSPAPTRVRQP